MSKRRGAARSIERQFAELRKQNEIERKRKDARREVRVTLKRVERRFPAEPDPTNWDRCCP